MININHVAFSYGRRGKMVLDDFSLTVSSSGVYGLLGPNGVGKSTLLYLITGLLTPRHGECLYDGVNTRRRLPEVLSDIFLVPEEFEFPAIKLSEYVRIRSPFYPRFSSEVMDKCLRLFDMPGDVNLGALSMGQRKKAMMSFALACNTGVVLMDEPTNGLDIPGKATFRRIIAEQATPDRVFIISTHQVRDIDSLLDHVIIMNNKRVLIDTPVDAIQRKLKFEVTTDRDVISSAYHAIPSVGGTAVVLPNDDNDDTRINLESLFDFAFANPALIQSIFANKKDNQRQ